MARLRKRVDHAPDAWSQRVITATDASADNKAIVQAGLRADKAKLWILANLPVPSHQ